MVIPHDESSRSVSGVSESSSSIDPLDASVGPAAPDESSDVGTFSMDEFDDGLDGTVTPTTFNQNEGINTAFLLSALAERQLRAQYPHLADIDQETLLEHMANETTKLNITADLKRATRAEMAPVRNQYLKAFDDQAKVAAAKVMFAKGNGLEAPASATRKQLPGPPLGMASRSGIQRNQSDSSLVRTGMTRNMSYGFLKTPAPEDAMVTEMHSNYWIRGEIGKGGFGTVYRAQHKLDRAEYAIKKIPLPPPSKSEPARYQALLTEIRAMARLEHGNIVRYYNSWIGVESYGVPSDISATARQRGPNRMPTGLPDLSEIPESEGECDGGSFIQFGDTTIEEIPKNSPTAGFVFETSDIDDEPNGVQQPSFESAISETHESTGYTVSITDSSMSLHNALVRHDRPGKGKQSPNSGPVHCLNIVMSLYPATLKDYLMCEKEYKHCFCPRASAEIFHGIVQGVEYLHNAGLIHRDIKPGNIFLTPGPAADCCHKCVHAMTPKIGDFGLVTAISPVNIHSTSAPDSITETSSSRRVGTSWYIPPEAGEHCGVDVWALGIVLCELLYKCNTGTERAAVLTTLTKSGTVPGEIEKTVPEAVEIIKGCLERKPQARWSIPHLKVKIQSWLAKLRSGDEVDKGVDDVAVWGGGF